MSTDLRELLELASDDVPDLDLAPEAWDGGTAAEPAGRATHGARRGWGGGGRGAGSRGARPERLTDPGAERHDDGDGRRGRPDADGPGRGGHGVPGARPARRGAAAALPGCRAAEDPAPPRPGRPGHPRRARARAGEWPSRCAPCSSSSRRGAATTRCSSRRTRRSRSRCPRCGSPRGRACSRRSARGRSPTTGTGSSSRSPAGSLVLDARDGAVVTVEVPDPTLSLAGWARDRTLVVARGRDYGWLIDPRTGELRKGRSAVNPDWADLAQGDAGAELRTFSGTGELTGIRLLLGAPVVPNTTSVSNTEGWVAGGAFLPGAYQRAVERTQGLVAVHSDLPPKPRVLAATTGPLVPKGAYRALAWGPRDVVLFESRSERAGFQGMVRRVLAWDVNEGLLYQVADVDRAAGDPGRVLGHLRALTAPLGVTPVATGRVGSSIHSLHDPTYGMASMPARVQRQGELGRRDARSRTTCPRGCRGAPRPRRPGGAPRRRAGSGRPGRAGRSSAGSPSRARARRPGRWARSRRGSARRPGRRAAPPAAPSRPPRRRRAPAPSPGRTVMSPGMRCGRLAGGRLAGGAPRGQAAVEHPHLGVAGPAQHPPGAARGERGGLVVDHDLVVVTDPAGAQGPLQHVRVGQRMPATRPGRAGEGRVEVEVWCPGDVRGRVQLGAGGADAGCTARRAPSPRHA